MSETIVGIDLGTTNSEVAAFHDGRIRVLDGPGGPMLPSCVGLTPADELLIGRPALNQLALHPDRTVRSVKRLMGTADPIRLADRTFTPPEISSLILRELARWAAEALGADVTRAVITVPAYFSDAQRQATREAGELAGLEVVRLVNEPTAASLAYTEGDCEARTVMIYDLGGGTFDVSIVSVHDEVTEVLASHGNTRLGGDDFDARVVDHLVEVFRKKHAIDLRDEEHRAAYVRLRAAAEEAKKRLSFEPFTVVREEALASAGGRGLHLDVEIARDDYEDMIRPLVEPTLESVSQALADAGRPAHEIDEVLLVGGSTRTPLISEILEKRMGRRPRQYLHPDLCVALGAGLLASRHAGHAVQRVLVDVSPYSFGISYLGDKDGMVYPYCYKPIVTRNTPLPVTRTELFYTSYEEQTTVEIEIFQGEDSDAMNNVPVGSFMVNGLTPVSEPNEVLCRMKLDLDGCLEVTAVEKRTSLSKHVTIEDATRRTAAEVTAARERLAALVGSGARAEGWMARYDEDGGTAAPGRGPGSFGDEASLRLVGEDDAAPEATEAPGEDDPERRRAIDEARAAAVRARQLLDTLHADDREEAVDLVEAIETAIQSGELAAVGAAGESLRELLFFVEGR